MVIPVGKGFMEYAEEVRSVFHDKHMFVDVDTSGNTLQKKVRSAQLAQYNFIFSKSLPPSPCSNISSTSRLGGGFVYV